MKLREEQHVKAAFSAVFREEHQQSGRSLVSAYFPYGRLFCLVFLTNIIIIITSKWCENKGKNKRETRT